MERDGFVERSEADKAEGSGGSGATDVFGVLPKEEQSAASLPVVHSLIFKADSSRVEETDQLMNLLRTPVVPAPTPTPVPKFGPTAAPSSGGFTQLLRALNQDQPVKEQPKPVPVMEQPSAPTGMSQVTSFKPPVGVPSGEPVAAPAGSFTQLFQGLGAQTGEVQRAPEVAVAQTTPAPGSFTQMFQAAEPAPVRTEIVAATAFSVEEAPAVAALAGSFTQMFAAVGAPEAAVSAPAPATAPLPTPVVAAPEAPLAAALPGPFTQMFRALDAAPPVPAAAPPGSFTQMFQTVSPPPATATPLPPTVAAPPSTQPGSFTQMFRAEAAPAVAPSYAPYAPVEAAPLPPHPPQAPVASPAGLTQLLRALDQPVQSAQRPYAPPSPATPPSEQPGSFTAVYGRLDGASAPSATAPPASYGLPQAGYAPPPPATPVQGGPSEFTRILNASTMREAALRGWGETQTPAPAAGAAAPAPAASSGAPQWAMPSALKAPEMPKAPQAPKLPEVKVPEAAKAAGGMQQYVPLLLILVIFLLLAILVAVVFLMKK